MNKTKTVQNILKHNKCIIKGGYRGGGGYFRPLPPWDFEATYKFPLIKTYVSLFQVCSLNEINWNRIKNKDDNRWKLKAISHFRGYLYIGSIPSPYSSEVSEAIKRVFLPIFSSISRNFSFHTTLWGVDDLTILIRCDNFKITKSLIYL